MPGVSTRISGTSTMVMPLPRLSLWMSEVRSRAPWPPSAAYWLSRRCWASGKDSSLRELIVPGGART